MLRSWSQFAVAFGAAGLACLSALPVRAQGLTATPTLTQRDYQNIDDHLDWINHKDCVEDAEFTFTLGSTGSIPQSADLHVWASTGGALCEDTAARNDAGCKQVFQGDVFSSGSTQTIVADGVKVREILREGSGPLTTETPETVCDQEIEDKIDVVLRFFILDSGGNVLPGVATYPVSYDLVGPEPPTSVKAGVGESALIVSWNASSSDEFLGRYNVYADRAGGEADAGAGGADSSGSCTSDDLVPGELPTISPKTQTNASTEEAEARGLTNGVLYAVGVASIDNFNNPGPLSKLDCGTPEPVTGFFEAYRDAGGQGGGGYCSIGAAPSRTSAAFVALVALGLVARRRLVRTRRSVAGGAS
jgi:hypothetical protein